MLCKKTALVPSNIYHNIGFTAHLNCVSFLQKIKDARSDTEESDRSEAEDLANNKE